MFGGPLAFLGILLLGTEPGRKALKKASREVTRLGVQAYDKVKEIAAEAREEATHLIEEAKSERNNGKSDKVSAKSGN
jgi:F0F1-type ATP synthase membrane subunit b/b'